MKTLTEYLTFQTQNRRELVRLTDTVAELVRKSGIQEGMVLVSAMHITAGVFVNDDESGLHEDIWEWLQQLWQQVFYAEFDGQRRKRLVVKVMGA